MCLNKICVGYKSCFFPGTYSITRHLQRHHPEQWAAYQAELADTAVVRGAKIKEEQERDESGTGTVRLYDVSTSGGRQAFLNQVGVGNIGL